MTARRAVMVIVAALALAGPAPADPAVIAESCRLCHGAAGVSPGAIPSLAGLAPEVMAAQLAGMRDGSLPATIMPRLLAGLTEDDIGALVDWIAANGWEGGQ